MLNRMKKTNIPNHPSVRYSCECTSFYTTAGNLAKLYYNAWPNAYLCKKRDVPFKSRCSLILLILFFICVARISKTPPARSVKLPMNTFQQVNLRT